jgi:general secretion pathway protein N
VPQPQATPDRIGPLAQYADAASRPLFTQDRRPRSFLATAGEGDGAAQSQALDFILTGVLISPQVQLAVLQPSGGGEAQRVRVGKSPEGAAGWRLLEVQPRRAIFEGGGGQAPRPAHVRQAGGPCPGQRRASPGRRRRPPRSAATQPRNHRTRKRGSMRSADASKPGARRCAPARPAAARALPAARSRRSHDVELSRMNVRPFLATAVLGLLAACASVPPPQIQRADRLPGAQAGVVRRIAARRWAIRSRR